MATESVGEPVCCFCGSRNLKKTHDGLFHPFKKDHGPFSFHRCRNCGSGLTLQPPTGAELTRLYASFQDGYAEEVRDMRQGDPQLAIYARQVRRMLRHAERSGERPQTWIDVGAGGGEMSTLIAEALPDATGIAVDLHECPASLASPGRITWKQADINDDHFAAGVGGTAQLVVSSAVWEHVLHPDRFIGNLLRLLAPGGLLYLMTPDYGSLACRLMGRRWPYFEPGEHLNMPTAAGAVSCLLRQWRVVHGDQGDPVIRCGPLLLPYSLSFTFKRIGLSPLGRLFPPGFALPLPTGILEAELQSPA